MTYNEFRSPHQPSIKAIQLATCAHYGVEWLDLVSERRPSNLIIPRHVAMYLSKKMTTRSFQVIGREFRRDHSVIHYAVAKIGGAISNHAEDIAAIKAVLGGGA